MMKATVVGGYIRGDQVPQWLSNSLMQNVVATGPLNKKKLARRQRCTALGRYPLNLKTGGVRCLAQPPKYVTRREKRPRVTYKDMTHSARGRECGNRGGRLIPTHGGQRYRCIGGGRPAVRATPIAYALPLTYGQPIEQPVQGLDFVQALPIAHAQQYFPMR